jgi:hypothetical protein
VLTHALKGALLEAKVLVFTVFVVLFDGVSAVGRELSKFGYAVLPWDVSGGSAYSLTDAIPFQRICGWIDAGKIWGLWANTPCSHVFRSADHIRGLPQLAPLDALAVRTANKLVDRVGVLLRRVLRLQIIGGESSPVGSYIWRFPSRIALAVYGKQDFADGCAFGNVYRQRLRLDLYHCGQVDLSQFQCAGARLCAFSGRQHRQLSAASRARGLHDGLCNAIAATLHAAHHRRSVAASEALLRPENRTVDGGFGYGCFKPTFG